MSAMETVFDRVLQNSWQSAVLVGLILGVQALGGRYLNARWRAALWLLLVVRLLVPVVPSSGWSLFNHFGFNRIIGPLVEPLRTDRSRTVEPDRRAALAGMPADPAKNPRADGPGWNDPVPNPSADAGWGWPVKGWLATIWLIGVGFLAVRCVIRNGRFHLGLRRCARVTDAAVGQRLAECCRRMGVRARVEIVETDLVASPALYGFFRWRLLLPVGLLKRLSPEEQGYLFVHELAHVRRHDGQVTALLGWLRWLHWFNPLIGYAYRRLRQDRELACDESVLARCRDHERQRYGRTIIRLLELGIQPVANPMLTGIVESATQIEKRVAMITRYQPGAGRPWVAGLVFVLLGLFTLTDGREATGAESDANAGDAALPPRLVRSLPAAGATDVDPALTEITVTFDRDMGGGFSWTGGGPDYPPTPAGQKAQWRDRRTCVLPVRLEAGHYYRVGINSTSYRNFRSAAGVPAAPTAIYFTTRGASEELKAKVQPPRVVRLEPANAAADVDPQLAELRVTFSLPMGPGFSWTGGGPDFPEIPEGQQPSWIDGGKTCVLPVALKPGHEYRLGINSRSHQNFQSAAGVPVEPIVYTFKTRANDQGSVQK